MSRRPACLLLLAAIAVGGALCAALFLFGLRRFEHSSSDTEVLEPGAPRASSLELASTRERWFALDVPDRTVALRVLLRSRASELRLDARRGRGTFDEELSDFSIATESGEATLSVTRFTDPPLRAGRWTLRVALGGDLESDFLPRTADHRLDEVPFTLAAHLYAARVDGILDPGQALASSIDAESGGFRSFQVEVPTGSPALRIDLLDVSSDLDLYVRRGGPMISLEDDVLFAQHLYGRESLVVGGGGEAVEAGTWFVDVVDVLDPEGPSPFRILATLDERPPAVTLAIPVLSEARVGAAVRGAEPVARALRAVVEIATDDGLGSGTLITRDGWILTNAHVVAGLGGESVDEVVVSATLDARTPPVELFRGRVERVDLERDLALVRVVSGFYGQPLPEGYVFPTLEIGDAGAIGIGDPIWLVGYPSTGGQGSRVTITCTHGVVSGWETGAFGPVIKTDAEITSGNSGGAAVDAQGRIVGVPTSMVELGSGQVAYVHPLSALPQEWRELLVGGPSPR